MQMTSRLINFGDALSQVGNVLLFNGNTNHSIGGDAYRYNRPRWMALVNWLFRDDMHCAKTYIAKMIGTHNAKGYRRG